VIVDGAFVWTCFPNDERPRQPDPRHVGYILGLYHDAAGQRRAIVAYTSSQAWTAERAPPGVVIFDAQEATALGGQKAFVLYLNRLARLPLTERWFPDIRSATQGVVAVLSQRRHDSFLQIVADLHMRRLLRFSGP
jgi:hypothetical protein